MCIFKKNTFQLVSETPNIPADYWRNGENDAEHHKRMSVLQRKRAEQHSRINASKLLDISSGNKSSASEETEQYIARSGSFKAQQ